MGANPSDPQGARTGRRRAVNCQPTTHCHIRRGTKQSSQNHVCLSSDGDVVGCGVAEANCILTPLMLLHVKRARDLGRVNDQIAEWNIT